MKVALRKEVKNAYVGFNRVRGGQQTYQSLKVTSWTNLTTKGMRKYQIKDMNERKQISGSTVAPALNAAQLTLWPH